MSKTASIESWMVNTIKQMNDYKTIPRCTWIRASATSLPSANKRDASQHTNRSHLLLDDSLNLLIKYWQHHESNPQTANYMHLPAPPPPPRRIPSKIWITVRGANSTALAVDLPPFLVEQRFFATLCYP